MTTSEAQVLARALYDSLISATLGSLRTAAGRLAVGNGEVSAAQVDEALPPDTPLQVRNAILLLTQQGKLGDLDTVARSFELLAAAKAEKPLSAEVISAAALDTAQQANVQQQLHQTYGERLDLRFSVDPSILGGLIIRVGDQVFDNSARTRLNAVQRSMMSS